MPVHTDCNLPKAVIGHVAPTFMSCPKENSLTVVMETLPDIISDTGCDIWEEEEKTCWICLALNKKLNLTVVVKCIVVKAKRAMLGKLTFWTTTPRIPSSVLPVDL